MDIVEFGSLLDRLSDAAGAHPKRYSLNLYTWLQLQARRYSRTQAEFWRVWLHVSQDRRTREHSVTSAEDGLQPHAIFIGVRGGQLILGSRLLAILDSGSRTQKYAYPLGGACVDVTEEFWGEYEQSGLLWLAHSPSTSRPISASPHITTQHTGASSARQ